MVTEVEQNPDGSVQVIAELDIEHQRQDVETNEVSDEYEVLTFYGHAFQIDEELVDEKRIDFPNPRVCTTLCGRSLSSVALSSPARPAVGRAERHFVSSVQTTEKRLQIS